MKSQGVDMPAGNTYKHQQFIDAIPGTGGIWLEIAERVPCSRETAKRRVMENDELRALWEQERAAVGDRCERTLFEAMTKDKDLGSIKWYLSRIRREEYGDALDLGVGGPIEIRLTWVDADEEAADE
jgi:hypothetical protein